MRARGRDSAPRRLEYWAAPRPGGFSGLALRETLDVPVIARVNGHALGCDIVVAVDKATFGLPDRGYSGLRSAVGARGQADGPGTAGLSAREAQMLRVPALVEALKSSDQDEGVMALQEKRARRWQGA